MRLQGTNWANLFSIFLDQIRVFRKVIALSETILTFRLHTMAALNQGHKPKYRLYCLPTLLCFLPELKQLTTKELQVFSFPFYSFFSFSSRSFFRSFKFRICFSQYISK